MKKILTILGMSAVALIGFSQPRVTAISFSAGGQPNVIKRGDCNSFTVTVKNFTSTTKSPDVVLHISQPSGVYQDSKTVTIGAGKSKSVSFNNVPLNQSGNHGIKAWCNTDSRKAIHRTANLTQRCSSAGSQADLAPRPPRFQTPPKVGRCNQPYIGIKNNGVADATGNIRAMVTVKQGTQQIWQQVVLFAGIPAGQIREVQVQEMNFPSAGSYTITVVADDINAVPESNEGNNTKVTNHSASQACGAAGSGLPDLVPMTMQFGGGGPKVGYCSEASLAIKNIGDTTIAGPVRMMFRVKQNGQTLSQQVVLFEGPIGPNQFSNSTAYQVHFPSAGTYQVERIVDDLNQVNEGPFESNNTKESNVNVSQNCN